MVQGSNPVTNKVTQFDISFILMMMVSIYRIAQRKMMENTGSGSRKPVNLTRYISSVDYVLSDDGEWVNQDMFDMESSAQVRTYFLVC